MRSFFNIIVYDLCSKNLQFGARSIHRVFSRYTVLVFSMSVRCHLLRTSGDMKNLQIASLLSLCLVLTIILPPVSQRLSVKLQQLLWQPRWRALWSVCRRLHWRSLHDEVSGHKAVSWLLVLASRFCLCCDNGSLSSLQASGHFHTQQKDSLVSEPKSWSSWTSL